MHFGSHVPPHGHVEDQTMIQLVYLVAVDCGCKAVNIKPKPFLCGVVTARVQKGSRRVLSRHFIKFMMRNSEVQVVLNVETMLTLLLLRNEGLPKLPRLKPSKQAPGAYECYCLGVPIKKTPIYDNEHKALKVPSN